ncbi:MurR/RpiR family transcriptional regulator [uncultured Tessaracoccus sp.]|uniref:MurR/RpiR family transcriptional regulator n=1 Tax=uncultured Tessaracoccus sp. TaxID=905023 RepID=UPI0025F32770|nr:MurR/RpiR family transcriptional regulator [uncultured Tessaracoccus sp.]
MASSWDSNGGFAESRVPLTTRIRGSLDGLQPAMARVGAFIVEHPKDVAGMTISSLAEATDVSETTVVRFCKEVGIGGYSQLRLGLALELGARSEADDRFEGSTDISPDDTLVSAVEKIAYTDARSVEQSARSLSMETLAAVVERVVAARRIDIFGVGASGLVVMDLQQKLHRIGLLSFALVDPHQALVSAALLDEQCVAIAISHSGQTADVIEALAEAKAHGATTVAITNAPRSTLAGLADLVLTTAATETTFRAAATGSRLAQLTVVDCLFVGVAQQRLEESMHALDVTRRVVASKRVGPPSASKRR